MNSQKQFWHYIRSFLVRYVLHLREKGVAALQLQEIQGSMTKMLGGQQLHESVITKVCNLQLKTDYSHLLILVLLSELGKWSREFGQKHPNATQCLLNQSLNILNSQQPSPVLAPRQIQLIVILMTQPASMRNLPTFCTFYNKLRDYKQFYPTPLKENQKQAYIRCMEQCIEVAARYSYTPVLQFIFDSIFSQLDCAEDQGTPPRLRLLRKLISKVQNGEMASKAGYLIVKYSGKALTNLHLLNSLISFYQDVLQALLKQNSIVPLLIFNHLIINNVSILLKRKGERLALQLLLHELSALFEPKTLSYFFRNYDWNYYEVPICQSSLRLLYDYAENRVNEKYFQYEQVRKHIRRANENIRCYLSTIRVYNHAVETPLYNESKRKYDQMVGAINTKPKKVLAQLQSLGEGAERNGVLLLVVSILRRSKDVNPRHAIQLIGALSASSAQLFTLYFQPFTSAGISLEECLRIFICNFLLVGEVQQIQTVIERITIAYLKMNDLSLEQVDPTYALAHALIILNTDLHNPNNENRMSEGEFVKMCSGIDKTTVDEDTLRRMYSSIKRNKINNFRDRTSMHQISLACWMHTTKTIKDVIQGEEYQIMAGDVFNTLLNQKETSKLETMVQQFRYDSKKYQCQIIEIVRKNLNKRQHLVVHLFQNMQERGNFKNAKMSQYTLSLYWLSGNFILNFDDYIPINLMCQFLIYTCAIRAEINDNLQLKQTAEVKKIKKSISALEKRESRNSIMSIFSNFLSSKDSEEEERGEQKGYAPFRNIGLSVYELLKSKYAAGVIDFFTAYIHSVQSKMFGEFISCLSTLFNCLYWHSGTSQQLFAELLSESELNTRITGLKKKGLKAGKLLESYIKYWVLRIVLKNIDRGGYSKGVVEGALGFVNQCNRELIAELLMEIKNRQIVGDIVDRAFRDGIQEIFEKDTAEVEWFIQRIRRNQKENGEEKEKDKEEQYRGKQNLRIQKLEEEIESRQDKMQQIKKEEDSQVKQLMTENKQKQKKKIQKIIEDDSKIEPQAKIEEITL